MTRFKGFTLIELLVAIAIIGALAGLAFPVVQAIRGSAHRTECSNRIRQLGVACLAFESARKHFPSGINHATHPKRPSISWLVSTLEFIEQDALSNLSESEFNSGAHPLNGPHASSQTHVSAFTCPSDPRSDGPQYTHGNRLVALTGYLGVCGTDYQSLDGVFYRNSKTTTRDIQDGASSTLLIGERPPSADNWYGWWYAGHGQSGSGSPDMLLGVAEVNDGAVHAETCPPGPYTMQPGDLQEQCDLFHFWSLHSGGAHFVHADGSVHFHSYDISPTLLNAMATIAGREVVAFD
jgi:prepilin-type N-terminal cleavage/methylation domain-containing protein